MALLVDALRPYVVPELYQVQRPNVEGVAAAIAHGAYTPISVAPGNVVLNFQNSLAIAAHYAADAEKFASASFETMLVVRSTIDQGFGVGWCIVQLYYSAFYAAHSMLRMFGCSCTFLPSSAAARLNRVLGAVGLAVDPVLAAGLHGCTMSGNAQLVVATLGSGGSHELFWRRFVQELDALTQRILDGPLGTVDAQDAAMRLDDVRRSLVAGTAQPDWLTRVRNEVQYRHGHSVWYPNKLGIRERRRVVDLIECWDAEEPQHRYPPATGAGDLPEFISACVFLTAACRGLILDIAQRTTRRGRSFVDYGPAKLLRETGH